MRFNQNKEQTHFNIKVSKVIQYNYNIGKDSQHLFNYTKMVTEEVRLRDLMVQVPTQILEALRQKIRYERLPQM